MPYIDILRLALHKINITRPEVKYEMIQHNEKGRKKGSKVKFQFSFN